MDLSALPLPGGQPSAAIIALKQALRREPDSRVLRYGLMLLLLRLGRHEEAAEQGALLLQADPGDEESRYHWLLALLGSGREDAVAQAQDILACHPSGAAWCAQAGLDLAAAGHWEAALPAFQQAVARGGTAMDHTNLLTALLQVERLEEAEAEARLAMERFREDVPLRARFIFALSQILLLQGRYREGWACYEARMLMEGRIAPAPLPLAPWRGEPLAGRPILLRWEQGYGDAFMALRFLPRLAAQGAQVLLEVPPAAQEVAATCAGLHRIIGDGEVLPADTFQLPLMSLPFRLGIGEDDLPGPVPYLAVPREVPARKALDAALDAAPPGLRLGLLWAGNPGHVRTRDRDLPPALLDRLAGLPGVTWVSLQREAGPRPNLPLLELGPLLGSFADSAHLLSRLDGLISVDTGTAHLAAALGRPVWMLLNRFPDWRWMLGRGDSPWYPTLRLWRQKVSGVWEDPIEEMAAALEHGAIPGRD